MRKIGIISLIIISLVIGMMISNQSGNSQFNITQDNLDKFEEYLENNEYDRTYEKFDPTIFNKVGNKGEEFIDKMFSKLKKIIN